MKTNKKLTYLLISTVVALWGYIVYKVVMSSDSIATTVQFAKNTTTFEFDQFATSQDSFNLTLNYTDPFQKRETINKTYNDKPVDQGPANLPSPNVIRKPEFIKYSGYITNPASKQVISILIINGKEQMLQEGQLSGQVKLLKNLRDSVRVSVNGQSFFISQSN